MATKAMGRRWVLPCCIAALAAAAAAAALLGPGRAESRPARRTAGVSHELVLAVRGQARFQIVVADDADQRELAAAAELEDALEAMTGADFAVLPAALARRGVPGIWVGEHGLAAADGLGPDGYVIRVRGDDLILVGGSPAGTANAVYGFLQDVLGVRWFMPDDEYRRVPLVDKLKVEKDFIRSAPGLDVRRLDGGAGPDGWSWEDRMRLTRFEDAWPDWALWPPGDSPAAGPEGTWTSHDGARAALARDTARYMDLDTLLRENSRIESWLEQGYAALQVDFPGLPWVMPRITNHMIAANLGFLHRVGAAGYWGKGLSTGRLTAPTRYMIARLAWDPELDHEALLEEFYQGVYREAAPDIRRFFSTLEGQWKRRAPEQWLLGRDDPLAQIEFWVDHIDTMQVAYRHLEAAAETAWSSVVIRRVAELRAQYLPLMEMAVGYVKARNLKSAVVASTADFESVVYDAWQLQLTASDVKLALEAGYMSDPYAHEEFKSVHIPAFYEQWRKSVEDVAVTAALDAMRWARERGLDEELPAGRLVWELLRLHPTAELKDMSDLVFRLDELKPVFEAGFERLEGVARFESGTGLDEVLARAPALVCGEPCPEVDEHFSHAGKRSLRYQAAGESRIAAWAEVEPGSVYAARAWAFVSGYEDQRAPWIELVFADAGGQIISEPVRQSWVGPPLRWEPIMVLAPAPRDAAWAVVTLGVVGQRDTGAAFFDDLALIRVRPAEQPDEPPAGDRAPGIEESDPGGC